MAGGKVVLSEGTFNVAASIVPTASLILEGQGRATILKGVDSLNSDMLATAASGTIRGFALRNLKVDGNRANNTSGKGVFLYSPRNCTIKHVWFTGTDEEAIYLDGAAAPDQGYYNWIQNNEIEQCDAGIFASNAEVNWITKNVISIIAGIGIFCDMAADKILYNAIDQVTGHGIHVEFGSGRWMIVGNTIDNGVSHGIVGRTVPYCTIGYNRITNLATNMIGIANGEFVNGTDQCENLLCQENTVEEASGATGTTGIKEFNATDRCTYTDNMLSDVDTALTRHGSSTNGIARDNQGHITENSGTATLLNGQTAIIVTHGLAVTPAAGDIMVTPMESLGAASEFFIDTYTSTQFTIHVDANPTQDVDFAWKAVVL